MKELALLTLDEALRMEQRDVNTGSDPLPVHAVRRRPPAPSPARLPSRTREYVLPPRLLPGPFSILFV